MPRWGRPPGARPGGAVRGRTTAAATAQRVWDELRVAEIDDAEEDIHNGVRRSRRGRQRAYNDDADETGSVNGVEYDLYDDTDSTVAYAVQLAMQEREDWLVEKALERIRCAHVSGQKNVRLSSEEREALDRRRARQTNGNGSTTRQRSTMNSPNKGTNGRTQTRRGSTHNRRGSQQQTHSSPVISLDSDSDGDKKNNDSGDEVQIIDVVQRRVPVSPTAQTRTSGRSRGHR
ncbi:uncharacterized protein ASPGLDRAFT_31225 [Aspergillus glaucus CBS 516.65]|uniref:Uncharacterized protein n=1 Tax=Aspergillus glaucus CBS 516.65 TaxID=1160497 RepID=A0A1L9W040_ASPGL|nr:hypothetical protein ASPGLDRAFT_31225 [Aspergillus glaucus CBS 516.65]OJJ89538.1 hypothetical protein ASPGLDRAFT_31225 [Aspergillus glaucus CBS 516.65]